MMSSQDQYYKDLVFYSQRMDQKGWVSNHDGNLSVKISANEFLATPTARGKFSIEERDLIIVDRDGKTLDVHPDRPSGKIFSEWKIHSFIYEKRPDVSAVVHAHAPYSMAASLAEQEILTWSVPEAVVSLGSGVPVVPLSVPASLRSFEELEKLLPHYDAVLMGGNGVFAYGKTLEQAFLRLELVEHLANVFSKSIPLGGPKQLDRESVKSLLKKREDAGLGLPADPMRPHWNPFA